MSNEENIETSWEFETASHYLIDREEIEATLTREHPMAILHASDGTCMVYVHESMWTKASYISTSLATEFRDAMDVFRQCEWPIKSSVILSRIVCAVRAVRSARLKKKYRNPLTCKVEMIKL